MNYSLMSDAQILKHLGTRIKKVRLDRNQTQAELANESGIGKRTVAKIEAGQATSLATLISVLRGLNLLANLEQLVPAPLPSPVELAKQAGRKRKHASKPRTKKPQDQKPTWEWAD